MLLNEREFFNINKCSHSWKQTKFEIKIKNVPAGLNQTEMAFKHMYRMKRIFYWSTAPLILKHHTCRTKLR